MVQRWKGGIATRDEAELEFVVVEKVTEDLGMSSHQERVVVVVILAAVFVERTVMKKVGVNSS